MAFADPQSVTIGGTTTALPRTGQSEGAGTFTSADGSIKLEISHAYRVGKQLRTRRFIRLTTTKLSADPLVPSNNVLLSDSTTLVHDEPQQGFTATELKDRVVALATFMTASTAAATVKYEGGES